MEWDGGFQARFRGIFMSSFSKGRLGTRALVATAAFAVAASSQAFILTHTIETDLTITSISLYSLQSSGSSLAWNFSAGFGTNIIVDPVDHAESSAVASFIGITNDGFSDHIVMALNSVSASAASGVSFDVFFAPSLALLGQNETTLTAMVSDLGDGTDDLGVSASTIKAFMDQNIAHFAAVGGPAGNLVKFSVGAPLNSYQVVESVPEPFTIALSLAGAGLGARRVMGRRRRTAVALA